MDTKLQKTTNLLQEYFESENHVSVNDFARLLISIRDKDAVFTEEEREKHLENVKSMVRKWKSGKRFISDKNLLILKELFLQLNNEEFVKKIDDIVNSHAEQKIENKIICDRVSKGRFIYAWDVEQKDLFENPYKYEKCLKRKPPFLSDEEFEDLCSLYPSRKIYEEILSKEKQDLSFEAIKFIKKFDRFLECTSYSEKFKQDAISFWRNHYIYYSHYETGRLYGSGLLDAPQEIFITLFNIWLEFYRGNHIGSYSSSNLRVLSHAVALSGKIGDYNPRDCKNWIYVGRIDRKPNENNYIPHQHETLPSFLGAVPICNMLIGIDMGKVGEIINDCYDSKIELVESTINAAGQKTDRYKVFISPTHRARKCFEWFEENEWFGNYEIMSYLHKNDSALSEDDKESDSSDSIKSDEELFDDVFDDNKVEGKTNIVNTIKDMLLQHFYKRKLY